ncbi:MAG: hypothetical protein RBQ97_11820, partial [Acholeplasma sp.]|nr:hypothetical protein [Acholeplasma sp.]
LFSLIFLLSKTQLIKESYKKTILFYVTLKQSMALFVSLLMATIVNYADKIVILAIFGGYFVSVYYTSTIFGKLIIMAITPLTGVALSYLVKTPKISVNIFVKIIISLVLFGFIGYFATIALTPFLIRSLYSEWADESIKIIPLTTGTAVFTAFSIVLNTLVMRFNKMSSQIYINLYSIIFHIAFVSIFTMIYDFKGFLYGMLVGSILKCLLIIKVFLTKNSLSN